MSRNRELTNWLQPKLESYSNSKRVSPSQLNSIIELASKVSASPQAKNKLHSIWLSLFGFNYKNNPDICRLIDEAILVISNPHA